MKVIRAKVEYRDMLVSTLLCGPSGVGWGVAPSYNKSKSATVHVLQ